MFCPLPSSSPTFYRNFISLSVIIKNTRLHGPCHLSLLWASFLNIHLPLYLLLPQSVFMEVLRRSLPTQTRILPFMSVCSPPASPTTVHINSHDKTWITHFNPLPNVNRVFATNSNRKYLRIMAGLGRLTSRRNSLRKKLEQDSELPPISQNNLEQQVDHVVVDSQASEASLGNSGTEQESAQVAANENGSESNNKEESKSLEESVSWNKLESWVEQYKKDIEFWGVGWRAILTVYEDLDGNIQKVLVDEEEILRSSGVNPLLFREDTESEDLREVRSKISHAKFLAREMESGKHAIPKNSSVATFLVAGQDSGFLSRIRSVSIPPNLLPKVSMAGILLVCGFLFLWVAKKLFTLGGNARDLTRFQKEMLRRKIKSRMEKERQQRRNADIEEVSEATMERPRLKQEEKEDELDSEQPEQNVERSVEMTAVNMDVKIQNVRMIARHVRKIETMGCSANDAGESDEQTCNEVPLMERETVAEATNSVEGDELEVRTSNEQPVNKVDAADTNGSSKEVQFATMQNIPSNSKIAEGSTADTQI